MHWAEFDGPDLDAARRRALWAMALACALVAGPGCDSGGGGDGGGEPEMIDEPDMAPAPPPEVECNEGRRRAVNVEGPLTCASDPDYVELTDRGGRVFHIFTYEASHPLATIELAFPCAVSRGDLFEAPDVPTEACSRENRRPWHSVRWSEANAACEAIGWRLCSAEELGWACGGQGGNAYPYGSMFQQGNCNVRESYTAPGSEFASAAPTGFFKRCVTPEEVYDLTGNVWEWTNERDAMDGEARMYQGAGWRTFQGGHLDSSLVCDETSRLGGFSAPSFVGPHVGFRCCRDAP